MSDPIVPAATPFKNPVVRSVRQNFIAGLIAIAPLYITFKILQIVFEAVDKPLGQRINALIEHAAGKDTFNIPGLGLIATFLVVLLIGWLTRLALFNWLLRAVEGIIDNVPLVRQLYNASRQVVKPFSGEQTLPFTEVCICEYPMKGRFTLGMIARHKVSEDPTDERIVVFFPSNHLHLGYPVILHKDEVTVIEMTVEEAIKFFVSCGVVGENDRFTPRRLASK